MLETISELLNDLKESPIVRAALADRDAKTHTARQLLVDGLAEHRRELAKVTAARDHIVAPLRAAEAKRKEEYDAAVAKRYEAQRLVEKPVYAAKFEIDKLERQLRASASPAIDAARREIRQRFDRDRHTMGRSREVQLPGHDRYTMKQLVRVDTNRGAIDRLLVAMREADSRLESLQLQNPPDLEAAIAGIVADVNQAWARLDELDDPKAA